MRKLTKGAKLFVYGLLTSILLVLMALYSLTANASEGDTVLITQEELCVKLVDMIQGNNQMLQENAASIKLNLFDEAMLGEMRDTSVEMYTETLKSMNIVALENSLLKEMYFDACQTKTPH